VAVLALAIPAILTAAERTEQLRELLRGALEAFDQAVAAARSNPSQAEQLYRRAAADFEALVASGVRNASLDYNLGNTYFRLGDPGRAVLHYRRALRLDPRHADAAANLEYVRQRVKPYLESPASQELTRRLLFWQHNTSRGQRFWAAAIFSAAGWLLLLARWRWRSGLLLGAGLVSIGLGLANAGLIVLELREEQSEPAAVLVRGEHVLRRGRGEAYEPARSEPLGPGVELRVLEQRADWVRVRLRNGETGWLPAAGVERV
jgi:tetratricopeptide (TPR) repeat protein